MDSIMYKDLDHEEIDKSTTIIVYVAGVTGLLFAFYLYSIISTIKLTFDKPNGVPKGSSLTRGLLQTHLAELDSSEKLIDIYNAIREGADSFLFAEYRICLYFIIIFGALVLVLTSRTTELVCKETRYETDIITTLPFLPVRPIPVYGFVADSPNNLDTIQAEELLELNDVVYPQVTVELTDIEGVISSPQTYEVSDPFLSVDNVEQAATENFVGVDRSCKKESKFRFKTGALTAAAFVVGACTSIVSGYLGMTIAVYSNARTTVSAIEIPGSNKNPWTESFNTAFRAGGVMGFSLCGLALIVLYSLILLYNKVYPFNSPDEEIRRRLFECVAGFGLGGSSIALFGRVGGGIYTKAADVGADLAGKVVSGIPEDDPRNPATIADNVGDNVGDVAGMGSDLFGSFAEACCAALIIANSSFDSWRSLMFPLLISSLGIFVCLISSFIATTFSPVRKEKDVEKVLKVQLFATTFLMTALLYAVARFSLPDSFDVTTNHLAEGSSDGKEFTVKHGTPLLAWLCVCCGLWSGCIIGFVTEYYTSHSYRPTQEVAEACETGAATNIIYGLALGYKSSVIPVFLLAGTVFITFTVLDMYGVALSALGMLSTLATCLSIDVYGPVCDNAGGIAEMSKLPAEVREKTDALDSAGNTTAAIGKGFAIGSACLVGLALFGAFVKRCGLTVTAVSILEPTLFAFLLIGAMIPYWFSAMTMKSVGVAAKEMVTEVARQFREIPGLLDGSREAKADHASCIKISTEASLKEMILPGVLVMSTPLISGFLFGVKAVCGLLSGAISSSVVLAISCSNTGGAWDNAKKYVEKGELYIEGVQQKKGTECHKAAVVGDTVGDPLKDTSGPALNIVMKLMAILSLVFADFFMSINNGHGVINWE